MLRRKRFCSCDIAALSARNWALERDLQLILLICDQDSLVLEHEFIWRTFWGLSTYNGGCTDLMAIWYAQFIRVDFSVRSNTFLTCSQEEELLRKLQEEEQRRREEDEEKYRDVEKLKDVSGAIFVYLELNIDDFFFSANS